jgi:Leucine-rich repeat (LRR) protein
LTELPVPYEDTETAADTIFSDRDEEEDEEDREEGEANGSDDGNKEDDEGTDFFASPNSSFYKDKNNNNSNTKTNQNRKKKKSTSSAFSVEMLASPKSMTSKANFSVSHGGTTSYSSHDKHHLSFPYELTYLHFMNLSHNQFQHLDDRLNIFSALMELDFSHNRLSSMTDLAFQRLKFLTKLNLSYNQLTDLPPSLSECGLLTELDLSYNRLEFLPKSLMKLTKLLTFHLHHNEIKEVDGKIITMFYDLKLLTLQYNHVRELPKLFYSLKNIQFMDLSHNEINFLSDDIANFKLLKEWNVSYNQLVYLPQTLGDLKEQLEMFEVHNNLLKELPDSIYQLKKLHKLTLQNNQIKKSPYLLYSLPLLKTCNLSNNGFEYVADKRNHFQYVKKRNISRKANDKSHSVLADAEEEEDDDDFHEMIFNVPTIKKELFSLREQFDNIVNSAEDKEKSFYEKQLLQSKRAKEGNDPEIPTEPEGKQHSHKKSTADTPEKVDNRELILKWLKKLRIHFNLSSELYEKDAPAYGSTDPKDKSDSSGKNKKESKSKKLKGKKKHKSISQSLSYSTISSDEVVVNESKKHHQQQRTSPSTLVPEKLLSVPSSPSQSSSKKFISSFPAFSFRSNKQPSPPPKDGGGGGSGSETSSRPDSPDHFSASFKSPVAVKSQQTQQQQPPLTSSQKQKQLSPDHHLQLQRKSSTATIQKTEKKKMIDASKVQLTSVVEVNQFFLFHLLSRWQMNAVLRNEYLLTGLQFLTNRSLLEYNLDINNPAQYISPKNNSSNEEGGGVREEKRKEKYQYSKKTSLLQQNLFILSQKQLDKKLFGKNCFPQGNTTNNKPKQQQKSTSFDFQQSIDAEDEGGEEEEDDDEEEEFSEEEETKRSSQENYEKSDFLLNHLLFFHSDIFTIIDHCCEYINLLNIQIFLEEFRVMKKQMKNPLWKDIPLGKAPSVDETQLMDNSSSQQPRTASGMISPPSGVLSPKSPQSPPQGNSRIQSGMTSPQDPLSPKGPPPSRLSLFSLGSKNKRRVTDNERKLTSKMTDFQKEFDKSLQASTEKRLDEITIKELPKKDSNILIEEVMKSYGNYLNENDLYHELLSLHYQYYSLPDGDLIQKKDRKSLLFQSFGGSSGAAEGGNGSEENSLLGTFITRTGSDLSRLSPTRSRSVSTFNPLPTTAGASGAQNISSSSAFSSSTDQMNNNNNNNISALDSSSIVLPLMSGSSDKLFQSRDVQDKPISTSSLSPKRKRANFTTSSVGNNHLFHSFVNIIQQNNQSRQSNILSQEKDNNKTATTTAMTNILIDSLPIMSLPLSLIYSQQDRLVRTRFLSNHFGNANVPLTEAQVLIQNKLAHPVVSHHHNKKKNKKLEKEKQKRELKQRLKSTFHTELPTTNTPTEYNANELNKYQMITESSFADDCYGEYSLLSCLLMVYLLLMKSIFLYLDSIEKAIRYVERNFIHNQLIASYLQNGFYYNLSKPFQFLQLFSSIDLSHRSYYYLLAPKEKENNNNKKSNKTGRKASNFVVGQDEGEDDPNQIFEAKTEYVLERKEDFDDIFYDIYTLLNLNTSHFQEQQQMMNANNTSHDQQKKKDKEFHGKQGFKDPKDEEKKANISIGGKKVQMVQEFLEKFYSMFTMSELGIETVEETTTTTTTAETVALSSVENKNKKEGATTTAGESKLKKQSSDRSLGTTTTTANEEKNQKPVNFSKMNTFGTFFTTTSDNNNSSNNEPKNLSFSMEEAKEWIELLQEYRLLFLFYLLQILENCKEILCLRGFEESFILEAYHSKRGDGNGGSEENGWGMKEDHRLLLSIFTKDIQNTDYKMKNSTLFSTNYNFIDPKMKNSLLMNYKTFIYYYAKVYQGLGIYSMALEYFYQFIQLSRGSSLSKDFYLNLVKIFLSQGNYFKANQMMNLTIKKFIMSKMNQNPFSPQGGGDNGSVGSSVEEEDEDDLMSISSIVTLTPLELLTLDREVAILYYFINSQYELFENNLSLQINSSYEKFLKLLTLYSNKLSSQANHYFNTLLATIPDYDYFYKIYHLDALMLNPNLSPEYLYGRNLNDAKYKFYLSQEEKKKTEKKEEKQKKMDFYNQIYTIKSKAMLLLEDDLIASVMKS